MDTSAERESNGMHLGVVVMLDVLGWKGIWQRRGVGQVMDTIERLRGGIGEIEKQADRMFGPIEHDSARYPNPATNPFLRTMHSQFLLLSDTIVLGLWPVDDGDLEDSLRYAQGFAPVFASQIIRCCATLPIPLLLRGSIVSGRFVFSQTMILGPAVDVAARLMNVADAALVVMDYDQEGESNFRYPVPLHDGRTFKCSVVNPFYEPDSALRSTMVDAFGDPKDMDLVIKKQNTETFLNVAFSRQKRIQKRYPSYFRKA